MNSSIKGQKCGALSFSSLLTWIIRWINSRITVDFRGHDAHVTSLEGHIKTAHSYPHERAVAMTIFTLQWRDGVSNHRRHNCLLNRLFRRRSKKTFKVRVTGRWLVNPPHKGPVMRKMFPFDDVIMKKPYVFWFKFHWSLFLETILIDKQVTTASSNGLVPNKCQAIILINHQ